MIITTDFKPTIIQIVEELANWSNHEQANLLLELERQARADGYSAAMQLRYIAKALVESGQDIRNLVFKLEELIALIKEEAES